jgi:hypothetical protein
MFDYKFDENAVLYELRLENSDSALQAQIIENVYERLYERMRSRVFDVLSDEEVKEFEHLSDEQINTWLTAHVPQFKEMFEEELELLIGEMKDFIDGAEAGAHQFMDDTDQEE